MKKTKFLKLKQSGFLAILIFIIILVIVSTHAEIEELENNFLSENEKKDNKGYILVYKNLIYSSCSNFSKNFSIKSKI